MNEINTEGLMERTAHEYREVLRIAVVDGALDLERIATWSASRRVVLKAALKRAGLEHLAGEVAKPPRQKRKDLRTPSEIDVQRMRASYAEMPAGDRACVFMMLQMGLRANEVLHLAKREVERAVDTGELGFTRKGDYQAVLPSRHVEPLLSELLAAEAKCGKPWKAAGEILSCGGEGTQYVRLYRLTRSLGSKIGFRGLRPHLLRHAFASSMIRAGAPLPVVQKALGHAQQQTTLRYVHADKSDLEKYLPVWTAP